MPFSWVSSIYSCPIRGCERIRCTYRLLDTILAPLALKSCLASVAKFYRGGLCGHHGLMLHPAGRFVKSIMLTWLPRYASHPATLLFKIIIPTMRDIEIFIARNQPCRYGPATSSAGDPLSMNARFAIAALLALALLRPRGRNPCFSKADRWSAAKSRPKTRPPSP